MARKKLIIPNATITAVEHAGTSSMGNPSYIIRTDKGDYRTQANSSTGYSATNYKPRHHWGVECVVTLELTAAGRITKIIGKDAWELYDEKRKAA